jgi:cytochrome c5
VYHGGPRHITDESRRKRSVALAADAKKRQCPACGRKAALGKTLNGRVCRWCHYIETAEMAVHNETPPR